ncbi:MAG TPA: 16S rRNA (guanine(527)-N(7))-methyltransferase RsmG, partial [Armatimonadetes bacterium]|nr:16S rRNA (guanine(527)-N(7))-methyltransferase RsmG [Armatimonadota bacterium]
MEIHVSQREILKEGAQEFGIELSPRQLDKFDAFTRLLLLWNQKFNITRITDPEEISVRHYLDSLAPLAFITPAKGAAIMDIGTGGGMPGIPLKIARPDIKLSLLDSTHKRLLFVEEAARDMELSEVKAIHSRAEDAGQNRLFRERYDFTVSRAVARLPLLAELC